MEAQYYKQLDNKKVRCELCPHQCIIASGKKGICSVRENKEGKLYSLVYNKPCSLVVDPIEKKPLYHFYPNSKVFSIATVGCNLDCAWCQNYEISQPNNIITPYGEVSAEKIVQICLKKKCSIIAFTYTEPTIFYEYMLAIAKEAKKKNIKTVLISNGYIEKKPLLELIPYLDAANIDLKLFNEKKYVKWTKGKLAQILSNIILLKQEGVHLEITTLIIPEINDDYNEIKELYDWISSELGKDQIIHISRFHPDYKMQEKEATPIKTTEQVALIAQEKLEYVYISNIGRKIKRKCATCGELIIKKKCACGKEIPGIFA